MCPTLSLLASDLATIARTQGLGAPTLHAVENLHVTFDTPQT